MADLCGATDQKVVRILGPTPASDTNKPAQRRSAPNLNGRSAEDPDQMTEVVAPLIDLIRMRPDLKLCVQCGRRPSAGGRRPLTQLGLGYCLEAREPGAMKGRPPPCR